MSDRQWRRGVMNGAIEEIAQELLRVFNGKLPEVSELSEVPDPLTGAAPPAVAEPAKPPADRVEVTVAERLDPVALSGSRDALLARGLGDKVANCVGLSPAMSEAERGERVGAAMAAMRELAPRNPAEGLLVAQMVAAHSAGLDRLSHAADTDRPADATELHSRQAARLMGLFARQYDSLLRNWERTRRTVRIEHVRLAVDGQTIVRAEEERSK